jgi:hypothetical protein
MGRSMEFESPGEAVRYIKSVMPLPEPFEKILLEYGWGVKIGTLTGLKTLF